MNDEIWKQISGWLWAVLLLPIAGLWRKVETSVSRQELKEGVDAMVKLLDTHIQQDKESFGAMRETQEKIFDKLDRQSDLLARLDTTINLTLDRDK